MQPKTEVKFDRESFNRLKRTIRNMSYGKRNLQQDHSFAMQIPDEVGIQLTNKCNLRCKHCFQWNEHGFHNSLAKTVQNEEINFDVVARILQDTAEVKSNLYLWGGEPLCYSEWNRLSDALEKDPRWTVLCTNGIDVEKKLDSILKISENLALLTSVEGFEAENDYVRGIGTYQKVIKNIEFLLDLKRKNVFKGEVSVNCVISESMIGKMYEFAEMFEEIGINTLYFCFPWYISETVAKDMDCYFKKHFAWLRVLDEGHIPSWHSYQYHLQIDTINALIDDLVRISNRKWKIRMRFQPALELEEVKGFILGEERAVQNKSRCIGIVNRMNVLPNGKVTVCKLFPEFEIGDLNENSVSQVWHNQKFQEARRILSNGLMPVCSKCVLLYLHGV